MTYRTQNLNEQKCYVWFFEDAPHLLKTARNCIYHPSNGNGTGFMLKERNFILWDHLYKILDQNGKLLLALVSRIQCFPRPKMYNLSLSLPELDWWFFARTWWFLSHNTNTWTDCSEGRFLEYRHKEKN